MTWTRDEIIDYFGDLINKIDIQTEKCLKDTKVHCFCSVTKEIEIEIKKYEDDLKQPINSLRNFLIDKVKEIERSNLQNLSTNKITYCFFIPNKWRVVREKFERKSDEKFCFFFNNKIGYLVVLKIILDCTIVEQIS